MRRLIAIPVYHLSCKVGIDKGRAWSVVDELLLWAVNRSPQAIGDLALASQLPRSVVVASLARMMRFRLVEVSILAGSAVFRSSKIGAALVGKSLPYFPKRIPRRVAFVVDRATGSLLRRRDVRLLSAATLDRERQQGVDVRVVHVEGGAPLMSPEENFHRLSELAVRGYDEQLASVDTRTFSQRDNEVLAIDVVGGVVAGLPRDAGAPLSALVRRLAREPAQGDVTVTYTGRKENAQAQPTRVRCSIDPRDILVGGDVHKAAFLALLGQAERRVIVHSTFLSVVRFEALRDTFRAGCRRGVTFDILWGAESDDDTIAQNSTEAGRIMAVVRDDPDLAGRVRVHMRSTGSHAKIVLSDAADDGWIAVVGSCNWLLSPFRSVEMSAVLRAPHAVSEVANSFAHLIGRRGSTFDELGTELSLLARSLRGSSASPYATGHVVLVAGEAHERIARRASGAAKSRIVVGSHRLGSTARPGALLQCAAAAARPGVQATVVYTTASGPVAAKDARTLEDEMAALGVSVIRASFPRLHAKFLAWDDDDIVVTSFNWASASVDAAFPQAELGVHLHAPGLAADVLHRLGKHFPAMLPST